MPRSSGWKMSPSLSWIKVAALITCVQGVLLTACMDPSATGPEGDPGLSSDLTPAAQLLDLSGRFLALAEANDDFLRNRSGRTEHALPDRSHSGVKQAAAQARQLLQELNAIARQQLSYEDQLTAALLQRDLALLIEAPEHHWLYFDVTPYNGGYVMSAELVPALNSIDLAAVDGVEHYLSLFSDTERFIDELANKLQGQRQRGILLPKAAIPRIRAIYSGVRENLASLARFDPSRLEGLSDDRVQQLKGDSTTALQDKLYPAIDRLLVTLNDDYLAQAPEAAGLYQYPGGEAYYKYLIRRETSLDLTPDQIHQMVSSKRCRPSARSWDLPAPQRSSTSSCVRIYGSMPAAQKRLNNAIRLMLIGSNRACRNIFCSNRKRPTG